MIVVLAPRMRSRTWRLAFGMAVVLILAASAIVACGGGNSITTMPPSNTGTPPGSYTITVSAFTQSNTSDGTNAHADASVAIRLTVN